MTTPPVMPDDSGAGADADTRHDTDHDAGRDPQLRPQRGIQSIEVGGQVLRAMVHGGRPMALKDLARVADMPPAKVHPYLVSFSRIGLVEQDQATGRYVLGPLALQLGLISLKQADPVQAAAAVLPELVQRIGHSVAVSVWGSRGSTIVRIEESPAPLHVTMRHGTVFSLAGTASGRLFAAFMEPAAVQQLLEEERRRLKVNPEPPISGVTPPRPVPSWRAFERELAAVRAAGLGRSEGETVIGVNAMSAPVFDHRGQVAVALTAVGPAATFDLAQDGTLAHALRACADQVSQRLGAPAARLASR